MLGSSPPLFCIDTDFNTYTYWRLRRRQLQLQLQPHFIRTTSNPTSLDTWIARDTVLYCAVLYIHATTTSWPPRVSRPSSFAFLLPGGSWVSLSANLNLNLNLDLDLDLALELKLSLTLNLWLGPSPVSSSRQILSSIQTNSNLLFLTQFPNKGEVEVKP